MLCVKIEVLHVQATLLEKGVVDELWHVFMRYQHPPTIRGDVAVEHLRGNDRDVEISFVNDFRETIEALQILQT